MKQLGNILIETWVEVPTKHVKGEQRYRYLKTWAPVPRALVNPVYIRLLEAMVADSEGSFVEIRVPAEIVYHNTPRYFVVRAEVQHVVTIEAHQ